MFLQKHRFIIKGDIVFQDTKSVILVENNGSNSCTGNSRHINNHYIFIKDGIEKIEVNV